MEVRYYSIKPCASGFGMYNAMPDLDETYDDADITSYMDGVVFEFGTLADVPDWIEDIRGKIHHEPERVFAVVPEDTSRLYYFGLSEA